MSSPLDVAALRALQRTAHELNRGLEDELAHCQLSPAEANALVCFENDKSRRMRELVIATAQRPSTLTGVVDRLERRGLVVRAIDPEDRRSFRIDLTPEGADMRRTVEAAYARIAERAAADVDGQQSAQLLAALAAIGRAADAG